MLQKLTYNAKREEGFTLVELLIVVAIIAILAAIAIPQFSAYRKRGWAATANSDIKNANTALLAGLADNPNFAPLANCMNPGFAPSATANCTLAYVNASSYVFTVTGIGVAAAQITPATFTAAPGLSDVLVPAQATP